MRHDTDGIWVTGLGLATPLGVAFDDFTSRILAGESGIRAVTSFDTSQHACRIGGFVPPLDCPAGWDADAFSKASPWEQLHLWCAVGALQDSGWWERRSEARIGLLLGLGAEWMVTWETDMHRGGTRYENVTEPGHGIAHDLRATLGLRGPFGTVAAACASGNLTLGVARNWIRHGWADVVVAGACERPVTPLGLGGFGNLGALSKRNDDPAAASRPFDRNRDGFVMSEGGAVFVLEKAGPARRRGAKVYAEIAGFGASSDAFHLVAPSEDHRHAANAMRASLRDAGLNPTDVDYVNAHATSTPVGDVFETRALRDTFGDAAATTPVSATKSMTGHMVGAASAVEAAICMAAFQRQAIPPTINLHDPDPECDLCHVANEAQPRRLDVALSNSFGFGGSNTCLVLKRAA